MSHRTSARAAAFGLPTRRFVTALAAAALALGPAPSPALAQDNPDGRPHIAVTAIVDHASIDAMRQGIDDSLNAAGLTPGTAVIVTFESAEASLERADAIARSLQQRNVSIVIALSEPSARAVAALPLRMPVIVAGLPVASADTIAANRKARLLTGVASGDVHGAHVELIAAIRPDTRRVVVPFVARNATEPAMVRLLVAAARTHDFVVEAYRIAGGALLPAGLDAATDIVYLALDAVGDRADALIREAGRRSLPVITDHRELVVRGATATILHDAYAIGRQAGEIAAAILRDPSLARQPIRRAEARFLVVNADAAADRRLRLAVDLTEIADEVIAWAEPDGPNPVVKPAPPRAALEAAQ